MATRPYCGGVHRIFHPDHRAKTFAEPRIAASVVAAGGYAIGMYEGACHDGASHVTLRREIAI